MKELKFLEEQAKFILGKHENELEDILIVLPNKRAITFLNKYISSHFSIPIFPPEVTTIFDWAKSHSPRRIASSTELLFLLYRAYARIEGEGAEDINSFVKWGSMLVSDFDEIERYIVTPQIIFKDLRNIKEIENWSFNSTEISDGQNAFLDFWLKLPLYYDSYNKELEENEVINSAKSYTYLLNNLDSLFENWKHIYFIGFNALSKTEEKIMFDLKKMGKSTIIFDMDTFYTTNRGHEASFFYDAYKQQHNLTDKFENYFENIPKSFRLIKAGYPVQQVNAVTDILSQEYNLNDSIALVLADENLVLPVVRSLPESIDVVNVTLGFPLFHTSFGALVNLLFELQFSFQKFKSSRLYYKTLLNFIDQPWLKNYIGIDEVTAFEEELVETNKVFLEFDDFIDRFPKLKPLRKMFVPWKNVVEEGIESLVELHKQMSVHYSKKLLADNEKEIYRLFGLCLEEAKLFFSKYSSRLELKSFNRLIIRFFKEQDLAFFGNPTSGLQVMGILETRTIDFDHVIVVGMNEGNLPRTNVQQTFIPRDLRKAHGLPCEEDRQAIFAHHFYRLIQRAKKIDFISVDGEEGLGGGEQSRYIEQLKNDIDFTGDNSWEEYVVGLNQIDSLQAVGFEQTPDSEKRIRDILEKKGLSPSALNKYVSCPQDFYYRYILGLKEQEEVDENIDASTFGTQIHEVLEELFKTSFLLKKLPLSVNELNGRREDLESMLIAAYEKSNFSAKDLKSGKNKLAFEISLSYLNHFLDKQIEEVKNTPGLVEIIALEQELEAVIPVLINGETIQLKLIGTIDRIDKIDGAYRIIDYKSGKCDHNKLKLTYKNKGPEVAVRGLFESAERSYGRQLALYSILFSSNYPQVTGFSAGIISMVNVNNWIFNLENPESDNFILDIASSAYFKSSLIEIISGLLSADTLFSHNSAAKYCEYCS